MLRIGILILAGVGLVGCVATVKPQASGESLYQARDVTFPAVKTTRTAKPGGLVHFRSSYSSRVVYRPATSFKARVGLGSVAASAADDFLAKEVDGKTWYCSVRKTYSDLLLGPQATACLSADESGALNTVHAAPAFVTLNQRLEAPVQLLRYESPWLQLNEPYKRELVFDGIRDGVLIFSQRIYEKTLEQPSRIKPHVFRQQPTPFVVTTDGAVFTVLEMRDESIDIRLDKAWR